MTNQLPLPGMKLVDKPAFSEEDFAKYAEGELHHLMELLTNKGRQYSSGKKAFTNFEDGAAAFHITPEQYLLIQANKHWYTMCQWSSGNRPEVDSKDIDARCNDVIIYMLILKAMVRQVSLPKEQEE